MSKLTALVSAVLGLGLLLSPTAADAARTYNLRMQTMHPPTLAGYIKQFARDVETASQGRVRIQVFTAGELIASPDILKAVGSGTLDLGHACAHYYSELAIGNIEGGLPMGWASPQEAQMIFDNLGLQDILVKEYEKHGAHYLASMWAVPYQLLTKKPVNSLEDMRSMKLRLVGATGKMMKNLGMNPVNVSAEDIYLAMSTGQIDGVLYGAGYEYRLNKFYEVAPYLMETPIVNPFVDHIIINKRVWDSMPEDLRAILKLATDKMRWYYYLMCVTNYDSIRDETFKGVTRLSAADLKALTDAAQAVWDEEAARGPANARAVEIIRSVARANGRLK